MELQKVILLYNIDSPAYIKALTTFCLKRGIRLQSVKPEEYDVPLGFVAYGTEENKEEFIRKEPGKEFSEPMMVFSGFPGQSLMELFKDLRIEGIGTTDLKAMMTENNAVWTSVALCEELKREHAAILAMQEKKREEMKKKTKLSKISEEK